MSQQFTPSPIKPTISFDDLNRIDIRVGTIVSIEDVVGVEQTAKAHG